MESCIIDRLDNNKYGQTTVENIKNKNYNFYGPNLILVDFIQIYKTCVGLFDADRHWSSRRGRGRKHGLRLDQGSVCRC